MQVLENDKREIEIKAGKMSDFLKMEYLESCLKKFSDQEIQKFCCLELSKLYESKSMYPDAIKYIFKFQELSGNPIEKKKAAQKEIELLIKAGFYDEAEGVIKKILGTLNESEKFELKRNLSIWYAVLAENAEKKGRNSEALKIYEKLIKYVNPEKAIVIKEKMINAYKKLDRIREAIELEKNLERSIVPEIRYKEKRIRWF